MNKSILISIQPQWVEKILNGEKIIEIRKTMPECSLPIDVYVYCTKDKNNNLYMPYEYDCFPNDDFSKPYISNSPILEDDIKMNGKVVANFTLNKVTEIVHNVNTFYGHCYMWRDDFKLKNICLTDNELSDYLGYNNGYAWHIDNLEVFDKPLKLSDFNVKRAPQSWQYVYKDEK